MNRRLELKTDLLKMEGAGVSRPDIIEQLCLKFHVRPKSVYWYYQTRSQWQPEIMGLSEAKEAYHQTLNRLEYIYQKFSSVYMSAPEANNKIGALRGMLETTLKKAELTGVLVPGVPSEGKQNFQSLIEQEVLDSLSPDENAVVIEAASLFMRKRSELMSLREQEKNMP
ncbi:hypothetical protein MUP01_04055 [Candidatus Bathyarchaeota archaeon]|nr:hypothetical protein [Candidatus Bathyarchaeota archaeon]